MAKYDIWKLYESLIYERILKSIKNTACKLE